MFVLTFTNVLVFIRQFVFYSKNETMFKVQELSTTDSKMYG